MSPLLNPDGLVLSGRYARTMEEVVLPYIDERRTDTVAEGDGGAPLFVSRFDADAPEGTVLLVHGFTENVEKFSELIHSLLRRGMSVIAFDQRGHGRSWRAPGLDDLSLTHVDRFDEYVRDMAIIYGRFVKPMPGPRRVFCHSMGGAVTALFLEAHPDAFDRAAMCAPMIAPNLRGLPKPAAQLICRCAGLMGLEKKRIFASRPYAGAEPFRPVLATGRARFEWYEAFRSARPEFQNNGPTYGWTLQASGVTGRILAPGAVERIRAAVRLYGAGSDIAVLSRPQERFTARLRRGERRVVAGAGHEIYRSADDVLFPWWHDALEFLAGRD